MIFCWKRWLKSFSAYICPIGALNTSLVIHTTDMNSHNMTADLFSSDCPAASSPTPLQQLTSCNNTKYTPMKIISKHVHLLLVSYDWSCFDSSRTVFAALFFLFSAKFCYAVISVSIWESSNVISASRIWPVLYLCWLQGVVLLFVCF